jgi:release factor glutamine methyltransferase
VQSSNRKVFYSDCDFNVPDTVYEPAEDSFLFADNLEVGEMDVVVDIGTGCGILGIIAAKKARKVLAIDVNPHALRCAKENARLNRVADKMSFVRGNLLQPIKIGQKFDAITFNPPYLPVKNEDRSWLSCAWSGGTDGRQVIDRFLDEAPKYLQSRGQILLMQSSLAGIDKTLQSLAKRGMDVSVVAHRRLAYFETLALVRGIRTDGSN